MTLLIGIVCVLGATLVGVPAVILSLYVGLYLRLRSTIPQRTEHCRPTGG